MKQLMVTGKLAPVTLLSETRVPDDVWAGAEAVFGAMELANVLTAVVETNAWDRVAVTTRVVPRQASR